MGLSEPGTLHGSVLVTLTITGLRTGSGVGISLVYGICSIRVLWLHNGWPRIEDN